MNTQGWDLTSDEGIFTASLELHKEVMEMLQHQDQVLMSELAQKVEWDLPGFALTMLVSRAGDWTDDYICSMQSVDGKETGDVMIHRSGGSA